MIIKQCDMDTCNNIDTHTTIYSMSQKFKEKYNLESDEHICKECLCFKGKRTMKDYKIDMGTLYMPDEDDREDYNEVDK